MVGSAAALLLMRQGLRVALVEERAPRPWLAHDEVDLRVVALAPSSIKLFEDLDVWTSIRAARASAYRRMRVWDASAAGELNFDAADRGDAAKWRNRPRPSVQPSSRRAQQNLRWSGP